MEINSTITSELRQININNLSENKKLYCNNSIQTAKYNFLTFLPLSLLNQFKSQFNVFQIVILVILAIREISPWSEYTSTLVPLSVILLGGMITEAIEDIKKTKYDIECNDSKTLCYNKDNNEFITIKWKNLLVGNIIKVTKDEHIPADILFLYSSNKNSLCYLQTTNLDGESTLKPKESLSYLKTIILNSENENLNNELSNIQAVIEVDQPYRCYYLADLLQ